MDEAETECLQAQRFKPFVKLRYIDDIFFIKTHAEENLNSFMKDFNNFKSSLKLTFECDRNSINFLHVNAKLNNDELTTAIYVKPTDHHLYLHYRSFHIKPSIVYHQTLGKSFMFIREDFVDHSEKM